MSKQDSQTSFEKRLAKYGAMSLAAAAGVLAPPADAALIVTTASAVCPFTSTAGGTLFFNGATQTCSAASAGAMFRLERVLAASSTVTLTVAGMSSNAVVAGDNIFLSKFLTSAIGGGISAASFQGGNLLQVGGFGANWADGDDAYVGLLSTVSGLHYGWAEIVINGSHAELVRFAYDDAAGLPPTTAPEPSSMALLALGAAGVAAYRRRATKAA